MNKSRLLGIKVVIEEIALIRIRRTAAAVARTVRDLLESAGCFSCCLHEKSLLDPAPAEGHDHGPQDLAFVHTAEIPAVLAAFTGIGKNKKLPAGTSRG